MTISMIAAVPVTSSDQLPAGWTPEGVRLAVAESVIDHHRFSDPASAVLAMHGDDIAPLFPSTVELDAMGVNVEQLAIAFQNGLEPDGFADTLAGLDVSTLNWALEELNEQSALVALHPDPVDRIMHRHEECGCC